MISRHSASASIASSSSLTHQKSLSSDPKDTHPRSFHGAYLMYSDVTQLFNKVKFGILLIDQNLIVQAENNKICEYFFGHDQLKGYYLPDLLRLEGMCRDRFIEQLERAFLQPVLGDSYLSLIRSRFQVASKTLRLQASSIKKSDKNVAILFSVDDVSILDSAAHDLKLQILANMILRQPSEFLKSAKQINASLYQSLQLSLQNHDSGIPLAFAEISRTLIRWNLSDLAKVLEIIRRCSTIKAYHIAVMQYAFHTFFSENQNQLKIEWDDNFHQVVEFPNSYLASLVRNVTGHDRDHLIRWLFEVASSNEDIRIGDQRNFFTDLVDKVSTIRPP